MDKATPTPRACLPGRQLLVMSWQPRRSTATPPCTTEACTPAFVPPALTSGSLQAMPCHPSSCLAPWIPECMCRLYALQASRFLRGWVGDGCHGNSPNASCPHRWGSCSSAAATAAHHAGASQPAFVGVSTCSAAAACKLCHATTTAAWSLGCLNHVCAAPMPFRCPGL